MKTFIIPNKKAPESAISLNGAAYRSLLELFYKKETIIIYEQMKQFLACSNSENP